MTDTVDPAASAGDSGPAKKRGGGLSSMLVADLKTMADQLGVPGADSMKKAQLVAAIKEAQAAGSAGRGQEGSSAGGTGAQGSGAGRGSTGDDSGRDRDTASADSSGDDSGRGTASGGGGSQKQGRGSGQGGQGAPKQGATKQGQKQPQGNKDQDRQGGQDRQDGPEEGTGGQQGAASAGDDGSANRRNRRRRGRDRDNRGSRGGRGDPDTTVLEDDVLLPAAGILDVLDNYAFVRTSGYLPGAEDVYVSLSMVRKHGLRRGDAIVGQVRLPREGERKEKFNPLVRVDSINGTDPEEAQERVDFSRLTPLFPSERFRLGTGRDDVVGRTVDIVAPLGKGQRGFVVSPARAGKTRVLQSVAGSIARNNPECHLMAVLVDERPEEVTEFERSVEGEVISSAFDRPASDHTTVAELAIERAKRLVELGHDVVVLLDGITRLGRAYTAAATAGGHAPPAGGDPAVLQPVKRFLGAARSIENGGSLTILATALSESGPGTDDAILAELHGTGNAEIRLRRDLADRRLFPAIDAVQSGTHREELLLLDDEREAVSQFRRALAGLEPQQALELVLERLEKSESNAEMLARVPQTTPSVVGRAD